MNAGLSMLLKEIRNSENKEIEYKRELPEHSDKYMKSVVAFAEPNITVKTFTIISNIFYYCFFESITLSFANSLPLAFSKSPRS